MVKFLIYSLSWLAPFCLVRVVSKKLENSAFFLGNTAPSFDTTANFQWFHFLPHKLCLSQSTVTWVLCVSYLVLLFYFILLILIGGQLHYNIVLVLPYIDKNPPWVYMCSPFWTPFLPPPIPCFWVIPVHHPKLPGSCIEPRMVIRVTCDSIHASMPFSQVIPPSPLPQSPKGFYTSLCLLLSCIQGYQYHLSKVHMHVSILYWCFSFWFYFTLYNRLHFHQTH